VAPLLEITDLRTDINLKQGVVHAVEGVSIHVETGETLGIVGESGCGKTMTALSIMQLLPTGGHITGGSITLSGQEISSFSADDMRRIRGNEIGMIFQDPLTSLNPTMTVGKQIAEAVKLHRGASNEQAMDRAAEVLNLVGLPQAKERMTEYPHQFSGGMRQRVMIAMALACGPELLIADEPTTALDATVQAGIMRLLRRIARTRRLSVLLISHNLGVISEVCDRVVVIYCGEVVHADTIESLLERPLHPYSWALLKAAQIDLDQPDLSSALGGTAASPADPPGGCRFHPRCPFATEQCAATHPELDLLSSSTQVRCLRHEELQLDAAVKA